MSKTSEDLKELIHSMKQTAGSKKNLTVPSRRKWDLLSLILVPICIGSVGGVAGFLLSGKDLMLLLPAVVLSSVAAFLLMFFWRKLGMGYGESDVMLELLKRRTVEMERDRFIKELEEAHRLLQASSDKQRLSQDELIRERAGRDEAIAEREQKNKLKYEFEKEKIIALLKNAEQKNIDLEQKMAEQEISWARKFEGFETHLREGTLKDLEAQYDKSRTEIVQEHYAKIDSLKREGAEKQRTLEETFKAETRTRDMNVEELNRKISELQNAADVKAISGANKLTEQMEKMRKLYEAEKASLVEKLYEQEKQFQAKLAAHGEQLNSQKIQIISACEAFVTELESREKELEKKEKKIAGR
ncbi:MAG: hypothetical protein A2X34_05840 [Elusimicrobia bacterium GWC2_51_8]|nr:MAG: hypothetical protein A2X33_03395 [Elusimicrobia bacterium GWA2_51_34]OGR58573.1 MAG: hypothetical protein A2X34_05840 [Elusimicrobia bacterium GWC2_51_8]OGR87445.1 MAG: hypothetical protein A2021_04700 [Elusimicrobia bacterium GWF2_52_66]HAF95612.1 hypothetical protein [Elusimicrobiota bacterium]HCE98302.1 hypothetical protein [Elusimicrobiota bacterium]